MCGLSYPCEYSPSHSGASSTYQFCLSLSVPSLPPALPPPPPSPLYLLLLLSVSASLSPPPSLLPFIPPSVILLSNPPSHPLPLVHNDYPFIAVPGRPPQALCCVIPSQPWSSSPSPASTPHALFDKSDFW